MGRRKSKVSYKLTPAGELIEPTTDDIKAILRAADEIIFTAGRSLLAKILRGSRDKKILEHNLDQCPTYGYFKDRTIAEITKMIDWMIIRGYLEIDYDGRLPMIVFSEKGWELYKPIYADELYHKILQVNGDSTVSALIEQLNNTNREVVLILLDKLGDSRNIGVIRFLEKWRDTEVKKVRAKINHAILRIQSTGSINS